MSNDRKPTILCLSSYYKGNAFLEECKNQGWKVILLTVEELLGKPWPRSHLDEVFALPSFQDRRAVVNTVSWLARTHDIQRLAPLDDYDVELVAHLREHLRIPGMGETTARYFRDKLAMRARCRDRDIEVPEFVHVLNYDRVRDYLARVPAPWLLKPRSEASAIGIKKLHTPEEVWPTIEALGDAQSNYLIEKMIPGDVFHVDSIVYDKKVVFAECHQYRKPLLEIVQSGGIFGTRTVQRGSAIERQLLETHDRVVEHLGIVHGVTHTEYIRGADDGKIYFLETAARVGGAHIADLVVASTGIDLWREWAKTELLQGEGEYVLPPTRKEYAGLLVSLAKEKHPDTSAYDDPEVAWRLSDEDFHAGLIVHSPSNERVGELLDAYERRFAHDFLAVLPAPDKALH